MHLKLLLVCLLLKELPTLAELRCLVLLLYFAFFYFQKLHLTHTCIDQQGINLIYTTRVNENFEIREVLNVQRCRGGNEYKMLELEGFIRSNV